MAVATWRISSPGKLPLPGFPGQRFTDCKRLAPIIVSFSRVIETELKSFIVLHAPQPHVRKISSMRELGWGSRAHDSKASVRSWR
jgi:hypothetical protein